MGQLIDGPDGLPAEDVGAWAKEKHEYLRRYVDISRAVRAKYLGPGTAGATYIDLFCGPGLCKIRDSDEWVDGGAVAAWKKSLEGGAPFSQIFIADLDPVRRQATATRLRQLEAPVIEVEGPAVESVKKVRGQLDPYGLHFAFLDPYNLEALDFRIIQAISDLKRIDILVHVNQMDLQRNLLSNTVADEPAFDRFAPGWRNTVDLGRGQAEMRRQLFEYWCQLVTGLGVWPSTRMNLIRGTKNQPLYWLLLAAKHALPHKFWDTASNPDGQGSFDF